ncbi:MAG: bifunctional phosphopantothenoylcysteine decarboxylase/phosphopantothenate--cysteine ligase CoaBC [bacterium]
MGDAGRFTVVLGVTGSIAAYKAAEIVRALRALRDPAAPERRVNVRVILTANGAQFITPVTLQTLTGNKVYTDTFADADAWDVQHIGLADDADVLLIAPASANIIAKLAHGLADDLLSSVALAVTAPLLVAPAMNVHMWEHTATQENVATLATRGVSFIGPAVGELACGYTGNGRLAPVPEIVAAVERLFLGTPKDLTGVQVLVTAGPTREFIDPVRYISNPSTGKMGYALARAAAAHGAQVTLVSGPVNLPAVPGVTQINVVSNAEMAAAVLAIAGEADIIIAAAAPADFTPRTTATQKIKKHGVTGETLELLPTTDILATVGASKHPGQLIVAFAAETERLEEYAAEKLTRKNADVIIANDVTAPGAGFAADTNSAVLLTRDGSRVELKMQSKDAMAEQIIEFLVGMVKSL